MKKRTRSISILCLLAVFCVVLFTGCKEETQEPAPAGTAERTQARTSKTPRPESAMKEIYTGMSDRIGLVEPSKNQVRDVVGLNLEDVEAYYIRYVEGDFGASDVYIIKPKDGVDEEGKSHKDNVTNALKERKDSRIREFSNYDVYNSTKISEDAIIFDRGGYVIMLMMEDNDAARAVIERYIPEKLELS